MSSERKVITVLFADLVGFTSQAEELDPEDVAAVLSPYHERLRYELERWGGTVEKFIGDAVMALFGAPVTREDDPERAVRAALAIRDWIAEEGKLEVRIAVNTGEALVSLAARPEAGEGMAAGDVVNTTARLQSAAPVNGILVGETTYRATTHTIDYREHEPVEAKGKSAPIPVWEVLQARARFGVDLAPQAQTPLIGRTRELDQLGDALTRSREQRSTELVTIAGVAGMGKSRLVGELFQQIERGGVLTYWRQGRSLPYGEGVSFWALAEMVKAHAGILESDSDGEVEAKLTRALNGLDDAAWVHSRLRPLVGQGGDAVAGSREEAFAAWRRFFESLAEERPLVLVFEDLQWADDGLLDFIEHLVDWVKGVPLLIVCTTRLELLERRPAWGGGKLNSTTMALAPLSSEETSELLAALSERPLLEAGTQADLLERAGGNPLYAEQYVRMLAERETLDELPESVQGIIAARLDALPADEKRLLQDAAVIGKVFWLGALEATQHELHALEQKDLVQRARRSSVEGESEFAFKHVLVRDVAYGQIPRRDRAAKHARVAAWIESLGRRDDQADLIAHHYSLALELTRSAGGDDAALADRARAALRDAADRAMTLNAIPQAEPYYRQALGLAPDDHERAELLFGYARCRYLRGEEDAAEVVTDARSQLERVGERESAAEAALLMADIAWRQGRSEESSAQLEEARRLIADAPRGRVYAFVMTQIARYAALGQRPDAMRLADEALELTEQLGLDDLQTDALVTRATVRANAGDRGALADFDEAIRVALEQTLVWQLIRAHNNLAAFHMIHGDIPSALKVGEEMLQLGERFGERNTLQFSAGTRIFAAFSVGQWDAALERADAFLAGVGTAARRYQTGGVFCVRSWIRLGRGDAPAAAADAKEALRFVEAMRDPQAVQTVRSRASALLLACGEADRVPELLDSSLGMLRDLSPLGYAGVELHHLAWVANRLGRGSELIELIEADPFQSSPWLQAAAAIAAGDFARGADLIGGTGVVSYEAFYRLQAGTDDQLRRALDFYRTVGATRFIREAEAQLPATA
jgi:class 3 adenylate cyclase/tetratricopeptide (TPR) repeat protein